MKPASEMGVVHGTKEKGAVTPLSCSKGKILNLILLTTPAAGLIT